MAIISGEEGFALDFAFDGCQNAFERTDLAVSEAVARIVHHNVGSTFYLRCTQSCKLSLSLLHFRKLGQLQVVLPLGVQKLACPLQPPLPLTQFHMSLQNGYPTAYVLL